MAEILLFGVIGDPFDKLDAATVCAAIRASTGPLSVRINSPGGYVTEGLAIIAALRDYREKVTVHIDGLAASMASAIAMVGDEIIMAESGMLMIHRPWDAAIGHADELRRQAGILDRMEAQLIGIYAKRTGLPEGELAAMLAAETWFTPDEALAAGFVTSIAAPLQIAACAVRASYGFRHTPDRLKETNMPDAPDTATAAAVALERTRISTIMGLGDKYSHKLSPAFVQNLIAKGVSLDASRAAMLDQMADWDDAQNIGHAFPPGSGHQMLDNPTTYGDAIKGALVAKIGGTAAEGPAAEFRGMSIVDMARDYLSRQGVRDVLRINPDRIINMAMQSRGSGGYNLGGLHTTSDFPDLVGGAAEKYLVDRYKVQESQLKQLGRQTTRDDFQIHYGVQLSGFGALDRVGEADEYKNKTLTTRKEGFRVETYGGMFALSRQMLVNDGLQALSGVLEIMAAAAAETEALLIAAIINNPPLMNDGKAWFHVDHGNLAPAGSLPTVDSLDAGRLAMRRQKDLDGTGLLDVQPKFVVVPVNLQTKTEVLVSSAVAPATAAEVNPFAGKLAPIADPRLASPTAWYLFGDPARNPAFEYAYLSGKTAPETFTEEGWKVDGTEFKVRHDFGAGVTDHRFAWKNPGA